MTMKPIGLVLALGVAAVLTTPMAEARGEGKGMRFPAFETLDLNGDGKIDREEAAQALRPRVLDADADGDGVVTREELRAHLVALATKRAEENADRMFDRFDADKDGRIAAEELAPLSERRETRMERMFDRLDRNDDGAISKDEYDRMAERMQRRGEGRQGKRRGWMQDN